MTIAGFRASFVASILCVAVVVSYNPLAQISAEPSQNTAAPQVRMKFSHALPQMDGSHLDVKIVEVTYPPRGSSTPHTHPCPVFVYVLEGTIRTQVKGEPEAIFKAGESFYEASNGVHQVSANASNGEPARFIAYFVCDRDTPLSSAVPETKAPGDK